MTSAIAKAAQAVPGADPERLVCIQQQGSHVRIAGRVGAAVLRALAFECPGALGPVVEAIVGADPHAAMSIGGKGIDATAGKRCRIAGDRQEQGETLGRGIKHGGAIAVGAHPQPAIRRQPQPPHENAADRAVVGPADGEAAIVVAVIAQQAVLGANPDETLAVLGQRGDDAVEDLAVVGHRHDQLRAHFGAQRQDRQHQREDAPDPPDAPGAESAKQGRLHGSGSPAHEHGSGGHYSGLAAPGIGGCIPSWRLPASPRGPSIVAMRGGS